MSWKCNQDSCYVNTRVSDSFAEGRRTCQGLGGDLMVIASTAEDTLVSSLKSSLSYWVGLTDQETEGVWIDVSTGLKENYGRNV